MSALFFDSSSLVKRYAKEIGTNWVFSLVRPSAQNRLYLARITGAEVVAALTKRMRVGSLTPTATAKAIIPICTKKVKSFRGVSVTAVIGNTQVTRSKTASKQGVMFFLIYATWYY